MGIDAGMNLIFFLGLTVLKFDASRISILNSKLDFMMGMGSVDHKADKQKKREEEYKKKEEEQNRIGRHHRELNPFWKDGGSGLPPTEEELQKKKEEERRAERRRLQAQLQNEPRKNTFSGKFRAF